MAVSKGKTKSKTIANALPYGKEIGLLVRYQKEANLVAVSDSEEDPLTYKSAIKDFDKKKWLEAIKLKDEIHDFQLGLGTY